MRESVNQGWISFHKHTCPVAIAICMCSVFLFVYPRHIFYFVLRCITYIHETHTDTLLHYLLSVIERGNDLTPNSILCSQHKTGEGGMSFPISVHPLLVSHYTHTPTHTSRPNTRPSPPQTKMSMPVESSPFSWLSLCILIHTHIQRHGMSSHSLDILQCCNIRPQQHHFHLLT